MKGYLFQRGLNYSNHSIMGSKLNFRKKKKKKKYVFHKNLKWNGARKGVFHSPTLKKLMFLTNLGFFRGVGRTRLYIKYCIVSVPDHCLFIYLKQNLLSRVYFMGTMEYYCMYTLL